MGQLSVAADMGCIVRQARTRNKWEVVLGRTGGFASLTPIVFNKSVG